MGVVGTLIRTLADRVRSARSALLAALLTAVLMLVAVMGMFVSTAPRAVSLLIEPFSLLLLPGIVVALVTAGAHDFSPEMVVYVSSAFYFVLFCVLLRLRTSRRRSR